MQELDDLDRTAALAFDGFMVRKDLAQKFKGAYPVPTYVGEFLLGRYCATTDEEEIAEGLAIVERLLRDRTVRAGEEELFKSRAREQGAIKLIDLIQAKLDPKANAYVATLPSLMLTDVRIDDSLVANNERMLTGGFYAEIDLEYDAAIAGESSGKPFGIVGLRPIQLSTKSALGDLAHGRAAFSTSQWKQLLLRSVGFEPSQLTDRQQDILLMRMIPFVVKNYNMVELGPRGTGKSHLFQQVSPHSHLISGGKATVARMFVNNSTGQRGLVAQHDVVCFDEISGVSFDQKDGVNIMKGYMESGEFSRGRESIRADGSIVLVGNFDVDVAHQQRVGHLLSPLPPEMRDDTAFMDRLHAYLPGWDVPKLNPAYFTGHFGLVSDFLSECWSQLRSQSRLSLIQGRIHLGDALSGRDTTAVFKTIDGLLKLLYPNPETEIADEDIAWAAELALECRRRVKEQQRRIGSAEFRNTQFGYRVGEEGIEKFVVTPELQSPDTIGLDPLPPGQVWGITPGIGDEPSGLYRIDVTETAGSGVRIVNRPTPAALRESIHVAEQNLIAQARGLVGDKSPREHEFNVQVRALDASKSGGSLGLPVLLALCSSLLQRSIKGGLITIGNLTLGGGIESVMNAAELAEIAMEKGAETLLLPVSARKQLFDVSDEVATKLSFVFYSDAVDALVKSLAD
ncbi:protease Lon-related BREX system protein BrxL [Agromyces fucosus]|uniref:Protease Lon-related BREX system protein BrxL n=1 Tax=Agromyces fucosus TaxID=41985 RepID=A0A4Q2JMV6_9MICO|nr:protease Lon-related BREX system protein BrxL [Agromyces fucosus]RXZ47567.1 protease Lon-related BREX system protein BrxL [Agromyces fucosus]